jgi:peptidoglycan/xylan/chitin deacetylase (PgdA/CDA1 family)
VPASVTIVVYHQLEAEPHQATRHLGISTPPDTFRRHLDYYAACYDTIGLDQLLSAELPERPLLITFDDAYRSVHEIAAPLLNACGMPAVLFANPRAIADRQVPLDNLLSLSADRHGLARLGAMLGDDGSARSLGALMSGRVSHLPPSGRDRLRSSLLAQLGTRDGDLHDALGLFLTPEQLASLPASGIEVANHTASHVHCRALSPIELESEIVDAKASLESLTGRPVRAFSFPYGHERDATPPALETIRGSGHVATFLVHACMNRSRPAADIWYRTSLTDERAIALPVALDLLPRLRSLKRGLRGPMLRAAAGA